MNKVLTYSKYVLGILFMAFVAYNFYANNLYYVDALIALKTMAFNIFLICGMASAIFFIGQKKLEIKTRWLIALVFLSAMLIGLYQFAVSDFSQVVGGSVVKEGTVISLIDNSENITESMEVLFEEGELVRSTSFIYENVPENFQKVFNRAPLFKSISIFAFNNFLTLFGASLFFVSFTAVGQNLLYRKEKKIELSHRLISFIGGAAVFSVAVFFLAWLGVYTQTSFLVAAGLLLAVSWKQVWNVLKFLWHCPVSFKKNRKEVLAVMGFMTVFLAMSLIDSIRVFPIAWDDINLYVRAARFLVSDNLFTQGIGPTAWTNLQSIPWLFVNIMQGAYSLLYATLVVGFVSFFLLARRFLNLSSSLWGTLFFALIPMFTFFYVIDTKIEIPLLVAGITTLIAWMNWLDSKKRKDLMIASALLGFTITIKITALILVVVLLLLTLYVKTKRPYLVTGLYFAFLNYFAWTGQFATLGAFELPHLPVAILFAGLAIGLLGISLWKEEPFSKLQDYKAPLIMLGTVVMFMLPWMIMHYIDAGSFSISTLIFGEKERIILDSAFSINNENSTDFAFFADYKRYAGPGLGWFSFLLFPWNTIMTPELNTFISDTTFIFLSIIPFWLLFPKRLFHEKKQLIVMLAATAAYVLMWMLLSSGVAWYGIFMFVPGTILLFYTTERRELWWKFPIGAFVVLSILSSSLLRNHMFAEQRMFAYSLGLYTEETLLLDFYPGFSEIQAIISEYQEDGSKAAIYRVGTQAKYFLPVTDQLIYDDDFLDDFSKMSLNRTTEDIKETIVDLGITHILFHRGVELDIDSAYFDDYKERRDNFEAFLEDSNWPVVMTNYDIILLEVQKNGIE